MKASVRERVRQSILDGRRFIPLFVYLTGPFPRPGDVSMHWRTRLYDQLSYTALARDVSFLDPRIVGGVYHGINTREMAFDVGQAGPHIKRADAIIAVFTKQSTHEEALDTLFECRVAAELEIPSIVVDLSDKTFNLGVTATMVQAKTFAQAAAALERIATIENLVV